MKQSTSFSNWKTSTRIERLLVNAIITHIDKYGLKEPFITSRAKIALHLDNGSGGQMSARTVFNNEKNMPNGFIKKEALPVGDNRGCIYSLNFHEITRNQFTYDEFKRLFGKKLSDTIINEIKRVSRERQSMDCV